MEFNLRALNGRTRSDKAGALTYNRHNHTSRIDYILFDVHLWSSVKDMEIISSVESDHNWLYLALSPGWFEDIGGPSTRVIVPRESVVSNCGRRLKWAKLTLSVEKMSIISQLLTTASDNLDSLEGGPVELHDRFCSLTQAISNLFIIPFSHNGGKTRPLCGRPVVSQRIVGGHDATDGAWPWQASVQVYEEHICGGTLITNSWVVSAAHCYYGLGYPQSSYRVCLGMYQLSSSNPNSVCSGVKTIIANSLYTSTGTLGDILLLELETTVTFTDFIMPVCLPASSVDLPSGLNCWVTGWGNIFSSVQLYYPQTLQEVMVPIITQSTCDYLYHLGSSVSFAKPIILRDMICAGYTAGGKDSCQGDSGGPLVCAAYGGSWFLAGIVSWREGCAKANRPGVYTRVTAYTEWIQRYVTLNSASTSTSPRPHNSTFRRTSASIFSFYLTFLLLLLKAF
ncbi:serine protease 27-like [Lissotriton helveticus]